MSSAADEKKENTALAVLAPSSAPTAAAVAAPSSDTHVEVKEQLDPELEKLLLTNIKHGLTDDEVQQRLIQFGTNEIPEKRTNPWLKFLSYFLGPISFLLEIATIIAGVLKDYTDMGILIAVLVINAMIGFFEEAKAENALDALKNTLALKSKCWRNGQLVEVESKFLVPGDVIAIRLGDIVPADCRLLGVDVTGTPTEGQLQIDQSALTGESLPVSKGKGDTAYSSSICKQGQMMGVVTKTGINTYIGRAANLISITTDAGHFQKVINTIGNFLIIITVIMAVIILLVDIYGPPHVYEDFYGDATNDPEERAFLLPNGTKVDFTNSLYGNISNVNDDYSHATYKLIPGSNLAQLTQYGWDNTSWTANITSSGYTTPLDQTNIFIFNYPSNTSSPPSYWAFPLSTTTITINALPLRKYRPLEALKQVIVLIIAAIPVGLPTVLSVTMAVGASQLAKKKVIVKRLTAIEELASVSVLCSDKTGTLTMNQLSFDEPYLAYKGATNEKPGGNGQMYDANDILLYSYIASEPGATDPIEFAVRNAAEKRVDCLQGRAEGSHEIPGFKVTSFTPFNPHSKYTEARVRREDTGEEIRCIKGAPQVIIALCGGSDIADKAVIDFAKRGLRALGVARTVDAEMQKFEIVGLISLLDPPRADSAKTIRECKELGIQVKMITGDQTIIAKEVAHRLGMHRTILDAHMLIDSKLSIAEMTLRVERADGFAQVIPEHKYRVVELLQDKGYLVGMTGDGVNDAPALKKANVGIAVEGCTDAARSAADIVLLAAGLSTIVDGVKTSRAIFQRMRSYALYRIASTIHFLLFFFTSILIWGFTLPDTLIILIAVLNDAATLVISVDNARINRKPDKWRLGQLITLSFILGFLLCLISYGHFLLAKYYFFVTPPVLQTIMYLQISSCPHFVIFSTRLTTNFWKNVPSWKFTVAVGGTQVFAMFVSIFGLKGLYASAIGWGWGVSIICVSLVSFMLLDFVKVAVIKYWSFRLTAILWPTPARRAEWNRRQSRQIELKRIQTNTKKMRKAFLVIIATNVLLSVTRKSKQLKQ